jgi:hypothetical protein
MKNTIWILATLIFVSGCSSLPPLPYTVSDDNNQALKQYMGSSVRVTSVVAMDGFNTHCRLMGPIQVVDGMTIPQFIENAFNDEFKSAGLYSDSGTNLEGAVTVIRVSSNPGRWDLSLTLDSSNGKSMSVDSSYEFKTAFAAVKACGRVTQALGPAVQNLVRLFVTDPKFGDLVK